MFGDKSQAKNGMAYDRIWAPDARFSRVLVRAEIMSLYMAELHVGFLRAKKRDFTRRMGAFLHLKNQKTA